MVPNYDITNSFERRAENVCKYGRTEGLVGCTNTVGCTNNDIYCTTVHSAHGYQVGTRGSRNLSDFGSNCEQRIIHKTLRVNMWETYLLELVVYVQIIITIQNFQMVGQILNKVCRKFHLTSHYTVQVINSRQGATVAEW